MATKDVHTAMAMENIIAMPVAMIVSTESHKYSTLCNMKPSFEYCEKPRIALAFSSRVCAYFPAHKITSIRTTGRFLSFLSITKVWLGGH